MTTAEKIKIGRGGVGAARALLMMTSVCGFNMLEGLV
jgi:hypothetical protein